MYQKCQYVFGGLRHFHLLLQLTISEVDSKYHLSDIWNEIMNKRDFLDRKLSHKHIDSCAFVWLYDII